MRVAIVDDSRLARVELKQMLAQIPRVELVGEAENAEGARELVERMRPDVLLLDIHMPGKDGFALLDELDHVPAVVFVTAYDEFALRAFEVNALDYLLKPVTPERLVRALDKYAAAEAAPEPSAPRLRGRGDRIFLRDGERCWFVRLADVRLLSVEGNYTRVHFAREQPLLARSLQYLEERLDASVFFRANRQQIVNLDWIERVDPWIGDGLRVVLKDGTEVEVSRRQARELRAMMEM